MTLLSIRTVPDPVLRVVCDPVERFDGALGQLAFDMLATMYAAPGRGLAAPQVGVTLRLFVMDVEWKNAAPAPCVFVNPHVLSMSDTLTEIEEGCLSIPGIPCPVSRPDALRLRWHDLTGATHEQDFDGFAARCIQHEADHLDGILCTDRVAR